MHADPQPITPFDPDPFALSESCLEVPEDLRSLFRTTWRELAAPGNAWSGADRIAIAHAARAVRHGRPGETPLGHHALAAVELAVVRPWEATETRVGEIIAALTEPGYVELIGIVAAIHGIDTATELLGCEAEALPPAQTGTPVPETPSGLRRRSAWVAMDGAAGPRRALSAAPRIQATVNRLLDRLYPETLQGGRERASYLHQLHTETVVLAASLANQCSFCVLTHLQSLLGAAGREGVTIDLRSIAADGGEVGFAGGRELVDLGRASASPRPSSRATLDVHEVLGKASALAAVERAAAIQMANRLTTMTGHRMPKARHDAMLPYLETVGALAFPHANLMRRNSRFRRRLGALRRRLLS